MGGAHLCHNQPGWSEEYLSCGRRLYRPATVTETQSVSETLPWAPQSSHDRNVKEGEVGGTARQNAKQKRICALEEAPERVRRRGGRLWRWRDLFACLSPADSFTATSRAPDLGRLPLDESLGVWREVEGAGLCGKEEEEQEERQDEGLLSMSEAPGGDYGCCENARQSIRKAGQEGGETWHVKPCMLGAAPILPDRYPSFRRPPLQTLGLSANHCTAGVAGASVCQYLVLRGIG
jgi:hypothetical protein